MVAQVLEGHELARGIKASLKEGVDRLRLQGRVPHLISLQVGRHPAAMLFVKNQRRACAEVGIQYTLYEFDPQTPEDTLLHHIGGLNGNPGVTGIIIQMPLPQRLRAHRLLDAIAPHKDVEGVNLANLGRLYYRTPTLVPCAAMGAFELIRSTGRELRGVEAVVVGHSAIVGKPIALLLANDLATVTICHIGTQDLASQTRRADVLVVAVGHAGLITASMVKPGAIVIDAGIVRVHAHDERGQRLLDEHGEPRMKTVGDVDFEGVREVASALTPVPGGVGPLTVAMLLRNTVEAARTQGGEAPQA
ncbi:MAG: bifunctional 5,10-methylenetetrahydrofolate dehydrogenase/5,10-methenyltetrahydrofolate cyclohydrolase [Planctomycetes bacterium]|nr:bifunctional 5,10-methylenetetrahydrofolate dehydrogenase/5,10-methenyltetrahydrofolate cyclohydrolase [Planctomycetota bacterium]